MINSKALIIGINNYASGHNLNGCVNDANLIANSFVRNNINPKNIKVLFDEYATTDNVFKMLYWLRRGSRRIKRYFYFAGHGSQVVDLDQDEVDGLDEIFLTHDGYITDDTIYAILNRRNALLVFDSCHSGTISRGSETSPRTPPTNSILDFYKRHLNAKKVRSRYNALESISACKDNETAQEKYIDGKMHGIFTYSLCRVLNKNPKYTFKKIRKELTSLIGEVQHPNFLVDPDKRFFVDK